MKEKINDLEEFINSSAKKGRVPVLGLNYKGKKDFDFQPPECCRISKQSFYGWNVLLKDGRSFELYIYNSNSVWGVAAAKNGELDNTRPYVPGFSSDVPPMDQVSGTLIVACAECTEIYN